jgi:hypothetical protein
MPGAAMRVINKQLFTLNAAGAQSVILARNINVSAYREALLQFRVHSALAAPTPSGTLTIGVYREALSDEDPGTDFVEVSPLASLTLNLASIAPPSLQTASLNIQASNPNLGGSLRIVASTSAAAAIGFYISADIVAKS